MPCHRVGNVIICTTPDYWIADRNGRAWRFEFHRIFGPTALKRDGEPFKVPPPEKSPFWEAVTAWAKQGKRTEKGVVGVWAVWDRR